jgi:ADP-heptose:LPS heptosyltransferase
MFDNKLTSLSQFAVVRVKQPVMFHQTDDETWLLNPNRRYLINTSRLSVLGDMIESVSELEGMALHRPLRANKSIANARILIERFRVRGIGDLLFLTGPLAYMQNVSGGTAAVDLYALSDRGTVLTNSPLLRNGTVLCGPVELDHFAHYDYQWLIPSATECNEEDDQLNVYDALFELLGFDHTQIDPQWKRPQGVKLTDADYENLHRFYKYIFDLKKLDLRRIGYYVVAPFANATPRCASYRLWISVITELSRRRPVVVVGNTKLRLPDTDMSAGEFHNAVNNMGQGVINAIDATPLRVLMALIQRSFGVLCLDSAPLYIAEALRVPAISLWGAHPPAARIGYDPEYMDMAVWKEQNCPQAPCFAYSNFPAHKCPDGNKQSMCEVLKSAAPNDVLAMVDKLEARNAQLGKLNK